MTDASFGFVAFGVAVAIVFNRCRGQLWRQSVLLAASIGFLFMVSRKWLAFVPVLGFLAYGYAAVRLVERRKSLGLPIIVLTTALFLWLKKYSFFPRAALISFDYLTLGLSYMFFRVVQLLADIHEGDVPELISPQGYLSHNLNFLTLVSGPIQSYQDFTAMFGAGRAPLDVFRVGEGLERIVRGLFKANVMAFVLFEAHRHALNGVFTAASACSRMEYATTVVICYPLFLYCNFSGYIDIVIGLGYLFRFEIPENFNRPFSAENFMNFWSRWHITLSQWLKIYVYNPLLTAMLRRFRAPRVSPYLGVAAFFVTFFLIGVWHGRLRSLCFSDFSRVLA
jgi:D-alanyl-lipoteichoic acid acyltransferase DltB (MBOAT superfamily)